MRVTIILWILFPGYYWVQGRPFYDDVFSLYVHQRNLLQVDAVNCSKGSDKILEDFPSFVSLRVSMMYNQTHPNVNSYCGGVLISSDRLITSTGCIYQSYGGESVPVHLVYDNLVNRTFDTEFVTAVAPYCRHGDGAEILQILGYHYMESVYTGSAKDGNAISVLDLKENVTSISWQKIPPLRNTTLPDNTTITMVGHGAATNEENLFQDFSKSRPPKIIQYVTISNQQCQSLLNNLLSDKKLDDGTETCAVVLEERKEEVGICNSDDGNPLYDSDGNIVGVVTWWPPTDSCDKPKDKTQPIIFANVAKSGVHEFIHFAETESLYFPPNITEECGNEQTLEAAPWIVSIQQRRYSRSDNPSEFFHRCGGVLIDDGKKILTVASCFWDEFNPLPTSATIGQDKIMYNTVQFINLTQPSASGNILTPIMASLAPRCRHFNGKLNRSQLQQYWIHPDYNGDPRQGNNIAIVTLEDPFPKDFSFPNFLQNLKNIGDYSYLDFSDVNFYGWGAEFAADAREDERGFLNQYFPAKEVEMQLDSVENCARGILAQDMERTYDRNSEICANQLSTENFTSICIYDNGGPLIGRYEASNQLVLLGLKSQLQDRKCDDVPSTYEVFTDIIGNKNFILSILEPDLSTNNNNNTQQLVLLNNNNTNNNNSNLPTFYYIVMSLAFVVACIIVLIVYKLFLVNKPLSHNKSLSDKYRILEDLQLSQDVQQIHQILENLTRPSKSAATNIVRSYSNLPAGINFIFSDEKIQRQISGYVVDSADDLFLKGIKGILPTSPYLLSVIQQQNFQDTKSLQKIQRVLSLDEHEQMKPNFAGQNFSNVNSNQKKELIFSDSPIREDFNADIDFEKELEIGQKLGTGAFGSVYRAFWATRNMEVAVKMFHPHVQQHPSGNKKYVNSIITEASLLSKQIDNTRIVKCYGTCLTPPNICLILEYLPNGSLDQFIRNYPGEIPVPLILRLAQEIAEGLSFLHPTTGHRDLKPQNILLDEKFGVKLVDFGLSKMKVDTHFSHSQTLGTPAYTAPEVWNNEAVCEKCDIYALGLVILEMVSKRQPWYQTHPLAIHGQVLVGKRPTIPHNCPPHLHKLINHCWMQEPQQRPTAREVADKLQIMRRQKSAKDQNFKHLFQSQLQKIQQQQIPHIPTTSSAGLNVSYSEFSILSCSSNIGSNSRQHEVEATSHQSHKNSDD